MDPDQVARFLSSHKQTVLATIRKDGRPQVSHVLTAYKDGSLLVSTTQGTAKFRNMRRDPRVTLNVLGDTFWQYLVVEGTVSFTYWPEAKEPLHEYYEIAAGQPHPDWDEYDRAMEADQRVLCTISIDRTIGFNP
jgi:PPOX class probable F420-dependent enzyme